MRASPEKCGYGTTFRDKSEGQCRACDPRKALTEPEQLGTMPDIEYMST